MPHSQSSEPGFESPFATVSKVGHFRSLHWRSSSFSCINEYLAIDSGWNVSDLVVARNCCIARMLPGEAELVSDWTCLPGRHVQRFQQSNGLDTALYKNYLFYISLETVSTTFILPLPLALPAVLLMSIASCREVSLSVGPGAGTTECVRWRTTEGLRHWFHEHGGTDNARQCRPVKVCIPLRGFAK